MISRTMSVCLSLCMKFKILVTTEPIRLYSAEQVAYSCCGFKLFSWGVGHPPPKKKKKIYQKSTLIKKKHGIE